MGRRARNEIVFVNKCPCLLKNVVFCRNATFPTIEVLTHIGVSFVTFPYLSMNEETPVFAHRAMEILFSIARKTAAWA